MKDRIIQLDYLKGIFILLMVTFHLTLIEQTYPVLRSAVYTFHMSAFLIISGYLANVDKDLKTFGRGLLRLVVPYVVFEAIYILLIFFLGKAMHASNSIHELSVLSFIDMIAEHSSGPYWYIHTLIICMIAYYLFYHIFKLKGMTALALMGTSLYGLTFLISNFQWYNVIYFIIGVFIFRSGKGFMELITPSLLAAVPLCILFASSENYQRGTLAGEGITILVISLLLSVFPHCPNIVRRLFSYLGKNSLAIVVFSPMFTIVMKMLVPYFSFDATAVLFALVAVSFVVAGCLLSAWLCDKLKISQYLFCKEHFYVSF